MLVVSKTRSTAEIRQLYAAGVREFAENREPELAQKAQELPDDIIWHFIGPLQSNKVRKVVKLASVVHSLDRVELIEKFDRVSGEEGKRPQVFLEVSISGEECKGGVRTDQWEAAASALLKAAHLNWCGLMTMAPLNAPHDELLNIFSALRELRDRWEKQFGHPLPQLSMGMSGDYREAVASGSTIVRIGTAVFAD